jgi:hypothetical protein
MNDMSGPEAAAPRTPPPRVPAPRVSAEDGEPPPAC